MIPGVRQLGEGYSELQESNPRLTNQLENIGGIASLVPIGGITSNVAKHIPGI